jgi:hypothetical protein
MAASGFEITLPDDWMILDGGFADAAFVSASLRSRFGDMADDTVHRLARFVSQRVKLALDSGAVYMAASSHLTTEFPVVATLVALVVARTPEQSDLSVEEIREIVGNGKGELHQLDLGSSIRLRSREDAKSEGFLEFEVTVDRTQFFVPVPDTTDLLVLDFSTPNLVLADEMSELFDAIASTARWSS